MKILPKTTKGAALIEYGLLVGLIAVFAIVAVTQLGQEVDDTFTQVSSTLSDSIDEAVTGAEGTGAGGGGEATPSGPPAYATQTPSSANGLGSVAFAFIAQQSPALSNIPVPNAIITGFNRSGEPGQGIGAGAFNTLTYDEAEPGLEIKGFYINDRNTVQANWTFHFDLPGSNIGTLLSTTMYFQCDINGTVVTQTDTDPLSGNPFSSSASGAGFYMAYYPAMAFADGDEVSCTFIER